MPTRGVHGDVDIGGVIDTPPPADKVGKMSLEENARAAAKAYSDALALYFCDAKAFSDAKAYSDALALCFYNASKGVIDTPPPANKVGKQALVENVCAARKAYSDALALDPVVQAVPAPIGLDVPALPEVIAPAVMPKPAAPLVPVVISPSVAEPDDFDELFPDERGETDVTGAFDDAYAYSAVPAAVVPKPAAPLFIDLLAPAIAPEPEPAALLVVNPVAPAVVPEPGEQHEHAHDDTDPFELHNGVLHAHDGNPAAAAAAALLLLLLLLLPLWAASGWAISMSNLLAAGDAPLLPENESLPLAAGDGPLLPESETLLLAAGDAPLLPENEALLLAAGDAPLLPENEALLLAAGDAPPLPTEESAPLVGDVDALHVSGDNMLGAGAALRRVAVVPPKLIVALAEPVLAMLEKAVPVVIGPLLDAEVLPPLDAEVLPPLDGALPASVYIKVVRASDDFFDKAQLLLKKSPLLDGYVLPELAAPKVDMPVVIELALEAEVLLQLDGAVPASMYAEEVRLLLDMLEKAVPVMIGPLLDAELLPPLDGAAPASVYVKVMRASDDFFDKAQQLLKKSPLLDGYALPELAAPEVDMPVVIGPLLDAAVLLLLDGAVPALMYVKVVRASDDFFDQAQLSLRESPLYVGNVLLELSLAEEVRLLLQVAVNADVLRGDVAGDSKLQRAMSARLEGGAPRTCGAADAPSGDATGDSHLQPHESVLLEVVPAVPELVAPEVDMLVVPGLPLDAELLLLGGAVPASRYFEVVRASDGFFDQLSFKESQLYVGNVLLEVSLAETSSSTLPGDTDGIPRYPRGPSPVFLIPLLGTPVEAFGQSCPLLIVLVYIPLDAAVTRVTNCLTAKI